MLEAAHSLNAEHNLTTFTSNFLCPQSNSMGRLLPYNDPRNPAWYVRRLNDIVAEFCAARPNAYLLNADELASHIGRRHVQDDIVVINSHGAYVDDWDVRFDQDRLHPPKSLKEDLDLRIADFIDGLWAEVRAMVRSLRQQDSIKIVICDLDDTLWRGVLAEEAKIRPEMIEGWPLGVIDAMFSEATWRPAGHRFEKFRGTDPGSLAQPNPQSTAPVFFCRHKNKLEFESRKRRGDPARGESSSPERIVHR
jgi:hypothetical protein